MIAAAGSGQRLGAGGPKALVEVAGRPLWEWSAIALRAASSVVELVVAAPPGVELNGVRTIPGGETRAESVAAAVATVEGDLVVVHDAARPLLTPELVDRVVGRLAASGADGVIAAAPVSDTLKEAGDGEAVERTVDRRALWAAQTPQAFRTVALRAAQASGDLASATDEAWLIERAGGTVLLERVAEANFKVTTAADLGVAEALLGGGRRG